MPGLFGIVAMDGETASREERASLFEEMARRLRHYPEERLDAWWDPRRGVYVGRIGLPHVHPVAWPDFRKPPFAFIAGALHSGSSSAPQDTLECVQGLRGFFASAHHGPERTLIAVDRHASLPVFFTQVNRVLLFAPEVAALLAHAGVSRKEDAGALANFIASGHLCQDQTLFQDIRRLRGGHALAVEGGKLRVLRYWQYHPGVRAGSHSRRELEEMLGDLVEAAVARNLQDPDKTVLFLSGGFDSRAILGGARKALKVDVRRLRTVSWGKDRGPDDSDVAIAQKLASALGMEHRFIQRKAEGYESRLREVNALVGAQSEIAAFHPHEYTIMKELREQGFERVLRGDECFGWSYHVLNARGALAVVGVHRLREAANGREFFNPRKYDDLAAGADASIDAVLCEVQGMIPDDAKDYFYFTHRLQGYLNSASYYKRCLLDQRNVLLDETFLDFMELAPARWRLDKDLFRSAMRRRFPDLYRIPMAGRHNLEDWTQLLGEESPVRNFALKELADEHSGIWDWFDREACLRLLETLGRGEAGTRRGGLKPFLVNLFLKMPRWAQRPVQAWRAGRPGFRLLPTHVLLRILTLKDWYDRMH